MWCVNALGITVIRCPNRGPNLTAIDPATATVVPLFHPRLDAWDAHFVVDDVVIVGRTPSGTAPAHHRSRLAEGWRRAPAQCRGYRWLALGATVTQVGTRSGSSADAARGKPIARRV